MFSLYRAMASLGLPFYLKEQWSGGTQVALLKRLATDASSEAAALADQIAALQRRLFVRGRVRVSLAGDPELVAAMRPEVDGLLAALPAGDAPAAGAVGEPWNDLPRHAERRP